MTLERPNPTTDLETTELDIRASYEDGESGVDPDSVDVRVDGTALDLADARILDAGRVEISHPVDAGNHTLSVGVADAFGNRRTERWNLTVVEPSGGGGGGSAGGGGGGINWRAPGGNIGLALIGFALGSVGLAVLSVFGADWYAGRKRRQAATEEAEAPALAEEAPAEEPAH